MLQDRKIIVLTGVSRGLGLALAEGFIERGHTVCGAARSASAVATLAKRWPAPHRFTAMDVAHDDQVKSWATDIVAAVGAPDLLVNNAALMNAPAPLWQIPLAEFEQLIDVNINGVFHVIRHFVPAMVARQRGVIVNLSSGWGRSTSPEVAPYCATKWAIEGLTRALAQELPEGMAAVPLNPGVINTDMLQTAWGADANSYPTPDQWAQRAVPMILGLSAKDNGEPLAVRSSG
ncbi:MAG TPA: SDR family oxidoreductase [Pirellulales bacterium]|jgi:NAD(P)-dependent dehydrogenase (short-subunit alcohol dehydrogenase family)